MFEVGGVNAAGIIVQDNKSKKFKPKAFGEDVVNSIIEKARSGSANRSDKSDLGNKEVLQSNNYKEFNSLMRKSKLSNSFLKEADLLAKGFEKNEFMDMNGGVYYTNKKTGEEIRLCEFENSNTYTAKDGTEYTQYFDKSGKPSSGRVTAKNKYGGSVSYTYENDMYGNKFITNVERTNPAKRRDELAAEGMKSFERTIDSFEESLGIPDNFMPNSSIVIKKDGTEEAVRYSEDGYYKITTLTKEDGSRQQIYSKFSRYSDETPVYQDLGSWETIKREIINETTGEKYPTWYFKQENYITGTSITTN